MNAKDSLKKIFLGISAAAGVFLGGLAASEFWAIGSSLAGEWKIFPLAEPNSQAPPAEPKGQPSPAGEASVEDGPSAKPFPALPPKTASEAAQKAVLGSESRPSPAVPEAPEPPESTESVQKLFQAFLEAPNQENYLKVLDALSRHPSYNPYSSDLEDIAQLLDHRRYEEAKAKLDAAMPNLLLSPRAHNYYRVIAEKLGNPEEAQRRDQIAQKCLQGIRATGRGVVEGSAAENQAELPTTPFVVSRVSDEYDVVRSLGKRVRVHSQSLRRIDGRWYDVLRCSDEAGQMFYVWFDVTRPMTALNRQTEKSP